MTDFSPNAQSDNFPPVFIGGAGRSGTTLVVDMLGLHHALSPIYETDFVLMVAAEIFSKKDVGQIEQNIWQVMDNWTHPLPHRPHNKRRHEKYFHGPHYILFDRKFALIQTQTLLNNLHGDRVNAFQIFIKTLFAEHVRLDSKQNWLNKTPAYISQLNFLKTVFPDMKFIHCVRDGRDVGCSVITRPWGPRTFLEAAPWWRDTVEKGIQFGQQNQQHYLEIRYEDLITEPAQILFQVFTWLGVVDDTELILKQYQDRENAMSIKNNALQRWKREATPENVVKFEATAGSALAHFGYL